MNVPVTTDEAVERFSAVLRQEDFLVELNRLLPSPGKPEPFQDVHIQMLKPHKNRVTFEMRLKSSGGWQSVICKVHLANRLDVFDAMQVIFNAGFGPESEFALPQPLAYLSKLHVLFEEKILGNWAMDIFMNGGNDAQIETALGLGVRHPMSSQRRRKK